MHKRFHRNRKPLRTGEPLVRTGFRYVISFLHTHCRSGISFLEVCEELGCQNH